LEFENKKKKEIKQKKKGLNRGEMERNMYIVRHL